MTEPVMASPGRISPQVAHALEIRSEVLQIICGDKAKHRGESDQLEIGAGGGTDRVTGGETLEVGGRLSEHVAHSAQLRAARVDSHVKGRLDLSLHSDMTLLGGAMSETWAGAVLTLSGMSDNMVGGIGTRVSVLDLWMSGLTGMEEKIATVAADLAFVELYVNHIEREYVAGSHLAGVAVFSGAVFTTMATGFRQLVKVASGVRDLGSGGDGGGGGGGPEGGAGSPPTPPVRAAKGRRRRLGSRLGKTGMLNDLDEVSGADDVRRAADTPPMDKPKRQVRFADEDVVILFEDTSAVDDLADVEDVRQGDDVGDVEDVRRLDEPDTPPEVPERTQDYYDKVMQDERKKNRIALALEIQALEKQFEGQQLSEWERLQAMQKILLDLQKQTDPDDKVRLEELKRLLENNKTQQADLVRKGKDTRAKRLETVYDFADAIDDQPPPLPARDPDLGGPPVPTPRVEAPRPLPESLTPEDYRKLYGIPEDFDFNDEWNKLGERYIDKRNRSGLGAAGDPNNPRVLQALEEAQEQIEELAKAYYNEALPPELRALTGHDLGENPTPAQVRKLLVDLLEENKRLEGQTWLNQLSISQLENIENLLYSLDANTHRIIQDAYESADAFAAIEWTKLPPSADIEKLLSSIDTQLAQARQSLLEVTEPEDVLEATAKTVYLENLRNSVEQGFDPDYAFELAENYLKRTKREDAEVKAIKLKALEDIKNSWTELLDTPGIVSVEDYRKLHGVPDDFNFADEWEKLKKWNVKVDKKNLGGIAGDPNNSYVAMTLADTQKKVQDLAKAYYDEALPPELRALTVGHDLGENPTPEQVRQLLVDLIDEQKRIGETWVSDLSPSDIEDINKLEDMLNKFDAKMYRILQDGTAEAKAFADMEWKRLPETADVEKLVDEIDRLLLQANQDLEKYMQNPNLEALGDAGYARRNNMIEMLKKVKQNVAAGYDPTTALDMNIERLKRVLSEGGAGIDPEVFEVLSVGMRQTIDVSEELKKTWATIIGDPTFHKAQALVGDDVARVLRRLPERYERVIVPRGAETPDDVRRALAPLRGDLTEVKDWEVLWYHRQLVDNTRQADELKRRFPSAFTETLALEYHELSQLYEDEWMRRFNTVEQVEEVFREGQRSGVHPLDAYVDPYVERFLGRGGQTVQPDPELVEKLTKFSEAFQPYVGRDADLVAKLGEYKGALWEMKRQESFHGAWQGTVYHGVDSTMGVWKQYTLSKGLGNRPGGYDILGDIDVVLEGIRVQLQKGVDPNAVFDSYLSAGRRLYFDDDMLGVSDAVVEVLRDAVNKLLADAGVGVVGRGAPVVGSGSGGRLFESLGPHILYYVQKAILMAERGVTLGTGLQLLEDGAPGGEKRRGAGWRAGGSGSVDGLPELLGEGRWVSVFEGDRVRWQWGGGGGGDERYTGSGGEGEGEAEADEEPEAEVWLGEEAEGAEARQAVRAGVPWRTAPGGGAAEVGAGEPTDIAGGAFAGVVYYTATTPSVGSWARRLVAPGGDGEGEGEESYETRRAWLEKVIGAGPEYARPPLPVLAGFGEGRKSYWLKKVSSGGSESGGSESGAGGREHGGRGGGVGCAGGGVHAGAGGAGCGAAEAAGAGRPRGRGAGDQGEEWLGRGSGDGAGVGQGGGAGERVQGPPSVFSVGAAVERRIRMRRRRGEEDGGACGRGWAGGRASAWGEEP